MKIDKGYVIRCHDLLDGSTNFRGMKEVFTGKKSEMPVDNTYTLSGAKRALSNVHRLCLDPDRYQYSIERLNEFYVKLESVEEEEYMSLASNAQASPAVRLNNLIQILSNFQEQVSILADELDSDTLEEAEADIDVVIDRLGDVLEENGWVVE